MNAIWQPLRDELAHWRDAGRTASFWLRDDDAVAPTAALDRLLEMSRQAAVPVALAVIPAHTGEVLAARLSVEFHIAVLVHGWAHENHAAQGEKKQELGSHRSSETVLAELARGLARLRRLHPGCALPVLVPPWNRIDPALIPGLAGIGFVALSVFGAPKPAPIRVINSNVDIIDWHGTRGCRDHAELVAEIVAKLEQTRAGGGEPVGILTHHLVHDESAWRFLESLFDVTAAHPVCRWRPVDEMLA
ncbi:MAG: polysaccharide deacetylase [Pseudaminobacter sp.]|nr:polysaccharide deacetylase [Pseudaminobacter sp.]